MCGISKCQSIKYFHGWHESHMKNTCKKHRITIIKSISETPMTQAVWEAAEDLLARMVAWALWADFQKCGS